MLTSNQSDSESNLEIGEEHQDLNEFYSSRSMGGSQSTPMSHARDMEGNGHSGDDIEVAQHLESSNDFESKNRSSDESVCAEARIIFLNRYALCGYCMFITLLAIILIASSVAVVSATDRGLKYNVLTAFLDDEVVEQGLHLIPAFGSIIVWPINFVPVELTDGLRCNSKDGVEIEVDVAFQFRVKPDTIFELTQTYEDFETLRDIIYAQARSGIRNACSDFTAEDYQNKRTELTEQMQTELFKDIVQLYKVEVVDLQLRNIKRPDLYQKAVESKESARSDISLATNEKVQQLTAANTKLIQAKQEANRRIDSAETSANVTLSIAEANADGIRDQIALLGNLYSTTKATLGFTDNQKLLSFLANKIVAEHADIVTLGAPSHTDFTVEATPP